VSCKRLEFLPLLHFASQVEGEAKMERLTPHNPFFSEGCGLPSPPNYPPTEKGRKEKGFYFSENMLQFRRLHTVPDSINH
jgi:hypothetical protein